jgi:ATP-binding cassette subfamily B protein
MDGQITLGMMLAVQYIIGQLNAPVNEFIAFSRDWQDAKISLERIGEIHALENEESAPLSSGEGLGVRLEEREASGSIILKDVSFQY